MIWTVLRRSFFKVGGSLSLLLLVGYGCAGTAPQVRIDGVTVTPSVIVPDYDTAYPLTVKTVEPQGTKDEYTVESPEVYAYLALSDFTGTRTIQWQWFDPSGNIYVDTGPFVIGEEDHEYVIAEAFHQIGIRDEEAALRPGLWHVAAILEGETFKRPFTIIGPPPLVDEGPPVQEEESVAFLPPPVEKPPLLSPLAVFFRVGKTRLTKEARALLDEWIRTLPDSDQAITITGHHDSTGPDYFNRWLADKRADVVRRYLVKHGVDASRLHTEGKPFVYFTDNATKEGRRENRRTMVSVE